MTKINMVNNNIGHFEKADSTWGASQAVPHPSTNQALCRLTSEVRRDPVHSTRYGRQQVALQLCAILATGAYKVCLHFHMTQEIFKA